MLSPMSIGGDKLIVLSVSYLLMSMLLMAEFSFDLTFLVTARMFLKSSMNSRSPFRLTRLCLCRGFCRGFCCAGFFYRV